MLKQNCRGAARTPKATRKKARQLWTEAGQPPLHFRAEYDDEDDRLEEGHHDDQYYDEYGGYEMRSEE